MATYYWTIDLVDEKTDEIIKEGTIIYASEFQAQMAARDMSEVPHSIKVKIRKKQFDF